MKVLGENIKKLLRNHQRSTLNKTTPIWVKQYGGLYYYSVGEWYRDWVGRSNRENDYFRIYLPLFRNSLNCDNIHFLDPTELDFMFWKHKFPLPQEKPKNGSKKKS